MKKLKLSAFAVLFALFAFQGCTKEEISPLEKPGYITLNTVMHKLWADHMQWTYATVDAFFNDANALQPNLDRLLKNQKILVPPSFPIMDILQEINYPLY
jgi:hypothetical protein